MSAFGVSGDPTKTHFSKFFGSSSSPLSLYSGGYRCVVEAASCASVCCRKTPPPVSVTNTATLANIFLMMSSPGRQPEKAGV